MSAGWLRPSMKPARTTAKSGSSLSELEARLAVAERHGDGALEGLVVGLVAGERVAREVEGRVLLRARPLPLGAHEGAPRRKELDAVDRGDEQADDDPDEKPDDDDQAPAPRHRVEVGERAKLPGHDDAALLLVLSARRGRICPLLELTTHQQPSFQIINGAFGQGIRSTLLCRNTVRFRLKRLSTESLCLALAGKSWDARIAAKIPSMTISFSAFHPRRPGARRRARHRQRLGAHPPRFQGGPFLRARLRRLRFHPVQVVAPRHASQLRRRGAEAHRRLLGRGDRHHRARRRRRASPSRCRRARSR